MLVETGSRFTRLWQHALAETIPDPNGAVGDLMRGLAEALDVELVEYGQVGNAALFLVNLGSLGFKDLDLNVVMVSHPPADEQEADEQARLLGEYKDAVRSIGFCFHVLLQSAPVAPSEFAPSYAQVVTMCGNDLERMFRSPLPAAILFEVLRRQVQLHRLNPFNTTREARGGMFRGRRAELDRLRSELDTNFLVTGARMIGKTSLLKKAHADLYASVALREQVFYFDCSVWGGLWDCLLRLVNRLDVSKERRLEQTFDLRQASYFLKRRSRDGRRPLILFFDECDDLVDKESASDWPFTSFLHEAAANRWVRVSFAGFRSVQDLQHGRGSPFHNRLEPLTLEALSAGEAEGLLCDPMRLAGVTMEQQDQIVKQVVANSAGQPFLVQFYGERLFQAAARRNPQEITPADVDEIDHEGDMGRFLKKHFLQSTMLRDRPAADERILSLLLAHAETDDGWTEQRFTDACREYGHPIDMDHADVALTHLSDARVFRAQGRRFTFTFPLMKNLLREDYPNLRAAIESLGRGE